MRRCINKIYTLLKRVFSYVFYIFPCKKKIVFDNFNGRGYGCNPKYIAEEIIREGLDYDLVWLSKDKKISLPKEIRAVKSDSIRALYEYATALIWIDNIRTVNKPKKKKSQYYIQTWHASLAPKKVEAEAKGLSTKYIKQAKKDSELTDLMIANNLLSYNQYKNDFWYSGDVIMSGVPRNSVLFRNNEFIKNKVLRYLNIDNDFKIMVYAPTFRANREDVSVYQFNIERCLRALEDKFGGEFICLLRLHPNIAKNSEIFNYNNKNLFNATFYPDIQELLCAADILITDYSSSMFDFGILKKPVFIYAVDKDIYEKEDQGFFLQFNKIPFPFAASEEQLIQNIRKFEFENYSLNLNSYYEEVGFCENGRGDEAVVKIIKERIEAFVS